MMKTRFQHKARMTGTSTSLIKKKWFSHKRTHREYRETRSDDREDGVAFSPNLDILSYMNLPPLPQLLSSIDALIWTLRGMRPLSAWELKELEKSLKVMEVYHSNAIEWNTLTLGETRLIVEDGLTIGGKPLREIHEAENLAKALESILSGERDFSEKTVQELHALIMRNIDEENAGKYRKIQVYISGDEMKPTEAKRVPELMKSLFLSFEKGKTRVHPVLQSARFHYQFVKIHPFVDGNGRTARLLSNLILLSHGYPMTIIPIIRRAEYISSLHSLTGSEEIFAQFYADIVHENLKDYMKMIA
jgi:Fic family protein